MKYVSFETEYLPVAENVSLLIRHYIPQKKTNNPAVVFVPGWVSLPETWVKVIEEMKKDFPIIYIETREKITSKTRGRVDYGVPDIARDIANVISHYDPEDYILFGSSLGATAILECYQVLHAKPRAVVLVGPNAHFRVPWWGKIVVHLFFPPTWVILKIWLKWYLRKFRLDVSKDRQQYEKYCRNLDAADPWKLKRAIKAFWAYQVWPLLAHIDRPVLIFGAQTDKLHEPGNFGKMVELLPRATFIDLHTNSATHSGQVVEEIRKYLKSILNAGHED